MIRRLLVANRGEIARRLIRGAHDAGCEAVAVYAADDAGSPHVGEADVAVLLAGASLAETYLSASALVGAAALAGADALHPGYGFLSENPALPETCAAADIVWVGPPPDAMRVMGHKARAKELVAEAGVPVLPSAVVERGADDAWLDTAAADVGYPLLVKASAGGGGRGMRLVRKPGELADAVAAAQREAAAAFGSDEVFLERYLEAPRHVEVQVMGDATAPSCTSSTGSAPCSGATRRWWRRHRPSWCPSRPDGGCGTPPSRSLERSSTRGPAPWSTSSMPAGSTSSR